MAARVSPGTGYDLALNRPAVLDTLQYLGGIDDTRWLKFVPADDGMHWFLYVKFRAGRWAGHYLCVRIGAGDLGLGLALLAEKLAATLRGEYRPSKDKYVG